MLKTLKVNIKVIYIVDVLLVDERYSSSGELGALIRISFPK